MLSFIKTARGQMRIFRLSTGREIKFWGPFETEPDCVEIEEMSSPVITPEELEELAQDFLVLAAELKRVRVPEIPETAITTKPMPRVR